MEVSPSDARTNGNRSNSQTANSQIHSTKGDTAFAERTHFTQFGHKATAPNWIGATKATGQLQAGLLRGFDNVTRLRFADGQTAFLPLLGMLVVNLIH